MAGSNQSQEPLGTLSLSNSARAALKRIELDYRRGKLDRRPAIAAIFDSLAGSVAGRIPYDAFEVALRERIPADAFRIAAETGIIDVHEQSAFPNVTLALLDQLQREYERLFEIIFLCDTAKHPEKAEDFITRDLPVAAKKPSNGASGNFSVQARRKARHRCQLRRLHRRRKVGASLAQSLTRKSRDRSG